MTPVELVLSKLPDAKRNGKGWTARCPAHDDHNPSLSISQGDDGRVLLYCHAGCEAGDVVTAAGLTIGDLMADSVLPPRRRAGPRSQEIFSTAQEAVAKLEGRYGRRAGQWIYTDAEGKPVGLTVRWEGRDRKTYRPVSLWPDGWIIGGMAKPRPLYHLPELHDAECVYVTEGEKAADAARSVGLVATTSANGSKSAKVTDWRPLAGKDVIVLPDNDRPGLEYAETVKGMLLKLSPPANAKVMVPGPEGMDLPPGGDMVEFIEQCHERDMDDAAIRGELERLVDRAPSAESVAPTRTTETFRPFPVEALPEPVRSFVNVGAVSIGCDPSYVALPVLSALAAAIGNSRSIELKRGWQEPSIIWTALIGDSGTMKSPALELALRPVRKRQHDAMQAHAEAMTGFREEELRHERDLNRWKRLKGDDPPPTPRASL